MKNIKKHVDAAAIVALALALAAIFSKAGALLQMAAGLTDGVPRGADDGAQPGSPAGVSAGRQVLADACTEKNKDVMFIGCNGLYY